MYKIQGFSLFMRWIFFVGPFVHFCHFETYEEFYLHSLKTTFSRLNYSSTSLQLSSSTVCLSVCLYVASLYHYYPPHLSIDLSFRHYTLLLSFFLPLLRLFSFSFLLIPPPQPFLPLSSSSLVSLTFSFFYLPPQSLFYSTLLSHPRLSYY